jgi:hypothetical protein
MTPIIKSNPTPAAPKTAEDFAAGTKTAKVLKAPRATVRSLADPSNAGIKIMIFGPPGGGKTSLGKGCLLKGFRIGFISTDIGGSGVSAIEGPLRRMGRADVLNNAVDVEINDYDTMEAFLDNPASVWPDIYEFDPDILFWDGFGSFQQIQLMEDVGSMDGGKNATEQRESGLQLETRDWNLVKQDTIRKLNKFCAIHNRKTGKIWHKVCSAHEAVKSKETSPGKSALTETKEPLLSGAGGVLARGAFDLILKTSVRNKLAGEEGDAGGRVYEYITAGNNNLAAKNRGFDLPSVIPGEGGELFMTLLQQRGLTKDQIDEKLRRT